MLLRLRNRFGLSAVIVLALLLAAGSDRAQSSEPRKLRIGTFVIPLMVVDEENGIFIELTNEILKRANLEGGYHLDAAKADPPLFLHQRR